MLILRLKKRVGELFEITVWHTSGFQNSLKNQHFISFVHKNWHHIHIWPTLSSLTGDAYVRKQLKRSFFTQIWANCASSQ